MSEKRIPRPVFPAACLLLLLFVLAVPAFADTPVKITRPADGARVPVGDVAVYTTFTYTGGTIAEFAAGISPMVVQVVKDGKVISSNVWEVSVGRLDLIDTYRLDVNLPSEGTYTIRAAVPAAPKEWSSVKVTASNKDGEGENKEEDKEGDLEEGSGNDPDFVDEGTAWWTIIPNDKNPGNYVTPDKSVYDIDLDGKNVVRINFKVSVDESLCGSDGPNAFYSDRLKKGGKKIVKFKAIQDETPKLKDGKWTFNGWIEYTGLKAGTTQMEIFVLHGLKWYDRHVITFRVRTANTMTVKGKTVSLKASGLAKKKQTIAVNKAMTVKKAKGKVSWKKVSGDSKITVAKKTGTVTVKKGLKRGTYPLKVRVTAAGNDIYKPLSKTVTVKIKVK